MKQLLAIACIAATISACATAEPAAPAGPASTVTIDSPMAAPKWAQMERQLLAENVPAAREFFQKYFDDRGYLLVFVRWGANDGPDDAFENFNHWPELHALGADDEIVQMYMKGNEGMLKQYSEAKTTKAVPAGVDGMYFKEFSALSDWQHHGEGLQLFNRMALSVPADPKYLERVRRFAGFYMGEDPEAPNYDPKHNIIRSMMNGSKGPLLRKATAIEWVGEPFDMAGFDALHGERNFDEFVAHYREYHDVVGDHALNLVATTLPANAYFATGDQKYKKWVTTYVDGWLERMKQNNGIIPTFVDLDGKIGGPAGKWWGSAYGWGFSPVNPVTNRRENRNRIERPIIGLNNALLLTGDQKYVDAWRDMTNAVNANARTVDGKTQYPSMYGLDLAADPKATKAGWYGWRDRPWNVGALEVWYFSQKPEDLARVPSEPVARIPAGPQPGLSGEGDGRRPRHDCEARRGHPQRSFEARQAARRQHARSESGDDDRADSTDAGRHGARPPGKSRQLAAAVFRSREEAGGIAGGCGRACLRDVGHRHGGDAGQPEHDNAANAGRAGRGIRRARDRIGRRERQDHRGRQAEFQRDAEPWSRQQADAEDETLQRRRDGEISLLALLRVLVEPESRNRQVLSPTARRGSRGSR